MFILDWKKFNLFPLNVLREVPISLNKENNKKHPNLRATLLRNATL